MSIDASAVPLEAWMEYLPLGSVSICELALPIAHNAATRQVKCLPREVLYKHAPFLGNPEPGCWNFNCLGASIGSSFAGSVANCQSQSITELLQGGIRGLDLRVSMHEGDVWVSHSVITTSSLISVLKEVHRFLTNHVGEVVLVLIKRDWDQPGFDLPENWARCAEIIESVFRLQEEDCGGGSQELGLGLGLGSGSSYASEGERQPALCQDGDLDLGLDTLRRLGRRAMVAVEAPPSMYTGYTSCGSGGSGGSGSDPSSRGLLLPSGVPLSVVPLGDANLTSSWCDEVSTVEDMTDVLELWAREGLCKGERGTLRILEVALPGSIVQTRSTDRTD